MSALRDAVARLMARGVAPWWFDDEYDGCLWCRHAYPDHGHDCPALAVEAAMREVGDAES